MSAANKLPTIRQLYFLIKLEEYAHFGKAAKKCFVSQPAFSIAIKNLEDLLGVALAERTTSSVTLTPAGKEVVRRAHEIEFRIFADLFRFPVS